MARYPCRIRMHYVRFVIVKRCDINTVYSVCRATLYDFAVGTDGGSPKDLLEIFFPVASVVNIMSRVIFSMQQSRYRSSDTSSQLILHEPRSSCYRLVRGLCHWTGPRFPSKRRKQESTSTLGDQNCERRVLRQGYATRVLQLRQKPTAWRYLDYDGPPWE